MPFWLVFIEIKANSERGIEYEIVSLISRAFVNDLTVFLVVFDRSKPITVELNCRGWNSYF